MNDGLFDRPLPRQHSSAYESMYRAGDDDFDWVGEARAHCEDLWTDFQEFADPNFRDEFVCRTHERWFEMYITVSLIRAGHKVTCRKPGPDILLKEDGRRIWIEATCATRGQPGRPDSVPCKETGGIHREPTDQYVLRVRNALDEKQRKYQRYMQSGIVTNNDLTVVAINVYLVDGLGPYIGWHFLRSLYGVGDRTIHIGRYSGKVIGTDNLSIDVIKKTSGADVDVRPFVGENTRHVSAVLGSCADVANRPKKLGDDFVLYPNLTAGSLWPAHLLLVGREWCFDQTDDSWDGSLLSGEASHRRDVGSVEYSPRAS